MQPLGITPNGSGLDANEIAQIRRPRTAKEFLRLKLEASPRPLHWCGFVMPIPHAQGVRNGEPEDREDQIPSADRASFLQLQATFSR
jgi:hypothetical protein